MKDLLKLIKLNKNARALVMFSLMLFLGVTMSRTIQVLWFEKNGHVENFGLSYSAMAFAGALSFFTGALAKKLGIVIAIRIGCIVYSIGLAFRIFTESPIIAILGGFIAGLGASTVFVNLQPWIVSWVEEKDQSIAVSLNQTTSTIGNALGSLFVSIGMILLAFQFNDDVSLIILLLLAALFPLIAGAFLPKQKAINSKESESRDIGIFSAIKANKLFSLGVLFFGALGGLYSSILTPYIPLMMKQSGLSVSEIGLVSTFLTITIAILNPYIGSFLKNRNRVLTLAVSEFALFIIMIMLLISLSSKLTWLIIIILLFRAVALTVSIISEQTLQMNLFNGVMVSVYFGMAQTSFWIGDTFGATLGGWIYYQWGIDLLIIVGAVLILLNSLFYPLFCYVNLKNKSTLTVGLNE